MESIRANVCVAHEQAKAFEQTGHPLADGMQQLREFGGSRPWCPMKRRAASFEIVHPVEKEHMEVNIEVQRRTEPLDQGDRGFRGSVTASMDSRTGSSATPGPATSTSAGCAVRAARTRGPTASRTPRWRLSRRCTHPRRWTTVSNEAYLELGPAMRTDDHLRVPEIALIEKAWAERRRANASPAAGP